MMKFFIRKGAMIVLLPVLLLAGCSQKQPSSSPKYVLVIHGGAGTMKKETMTPEKEEQYRAALTRSALAGYSVIRQGGTSTDAVIAAINVMEDDSLFNAGRGAVFTHDGRNEMDAAIMEGHTRAAGAVATVTTVKNPINLAWAVMKQSGHVMLAGAGAEEFARRAGIETVEPSYFRTVRRWESLQRVLREDSTEVGPLPPGNENRPAVKNKDDKFGTVGAVALDRQGHLTAGTSTGGMNNKKFGRIGDSPLIGAGTYANEEVGISCTGWGEFFIRSVAAYDVAALMQYKSLPVAGAGDTVVNKIGRLGGTGGMIILDRNGQVAMPFNTDGMYRAIVDENGKVTVEIYK